jgi:hypothetical protein
MNARAPGLFLALLMMASAPSASAQNVRPFTAPGAAAGAARDLPGTRSLSDMIRSALALPPPTALIADSPKANDGLYAELVWTASTAEPSDPEAPGDPDDPRPRFAGYVVLRADDDGEARPVKVSVEKVGEQRQIHDKLVDDPLKKRPPKKVTYRVASATQAALAAQKAWFEAQAMVEQSPEDPALAARAAEALARLNTAILPSTSGPAATAVRANWFNMARLPLLLLILGMGGLMAGFNVWMRKHGPAAIRRIPGIDAIEEAIGRATEMGRPVLYVPGIDELQDMQTIASMLILGRVSEIVARYDSDILVSCCIPVVREVADEVVRTGYYEAGRPDAYRPENTRFISSEQFAFCAGTNGIMYREKPAANILLGRFFAESLILAETGYVNGSIQVAGTAEATQLPFFIAACDYTLIGEELFAVSAYLSQDARLISSLKASDWIKLFLIASLVLGTVASSVGIDIFVNLFSLGAG